jgi:hypothetical protein
MRQAETQAAPFSQTGSQTGTQNASHARMQAGTQAAGTQNANHAMRQAGTQAASMRQHETQSAPVSQTGPEARTQAASMRQAKRHARRQAGTQSGTQIASHAGNHQPATVSHPTQQKGAKRGRKRKAQSDTLGTQQSVNQ